MYDEKRVDVKIMGLVFGDSIGWDDMGDFSIYQYDFLPLPEYKFLLKEHVKENDWEYGIFIDALSGHIQIDIYLPGKDSSTTIVADWNFVDIIKETLNEAT